jgi:hypothetical protein
LAHRALKAFYPLTNKLDTPAQLAKHERRRRVLRRVAGHNSRTTDQPLVDFPAGLKDHHYIPTISHNNPLDLHSFLRDHDNDPALTVGGALLMFTLFNILCRRSYPNSRTTFYIVFETYMSAIATILSQMPNAIQLSSRTTDSTPCKQCRYVTHTIILSVHDTSI